MCRAESPSLDSQHGYRIAEINSLEWEERSPKPGEGTRDPAPVAQIPSTSFIEHLPFMCSMKPGALA